MRRECDALCKVVPVGLAFAFGPSRSVFPSTYSIRARTIKSRKGRQIRQCFEMVGSKGCHLEDGTIVKRER